MRSPARGAQSMRAARRVPRPPAPGLCVARAVIMSTPEEAWKPLYRTGAWAAIAVLVLVPFQMLVFVAWPPPETAEGWFRLFERNVVVGLLDMDLLLIVDQVLIGVMFLAIAVALWR